MWDHKNSSQLTLFVEKFETQMFEFQDKFEKVLRGENPYQSQDLDKSED
jgi:hypothetical protein